MHTFVAPLFRLPLGTRRWVQSPCVHPRGSANPGCRLPLRVTMATAAAAAAPAYSGAPTILVTNDDGICAESALAVSLAAALASAGHDVTVLAPGRNNSACGQSITLHGALTMEHHPDLEERFGPRASAGSLRVFSVTEGTPADCVAAAIEPGTGLLALMGRYPRMVVSGVNMGPNLGSDVIYSGTFAGARQGAMYGVPSMASSLATWKLDGPHRRALLNSAVDITVQLVESVLRILPDARPQGRTGKMQRGRGGLRENFARGDVLLNVNVPAKWDGKFAATSLDSVTCHDVVHLDKVPEGKNDAVKFRIGGGRMESISGPGSDTMAVEKGLVSVSTVQTWPWSHPLALPEEIMEEGFETDDSGLPKWMATAVPLAVKR